MFHLDNPLSAPTLRLTPFQRGDNYPDTGGSVTCYDKKTRNHVNIRCDFVAGCDGFHGVSRRSIPDMDVNVFENNLNFSWLAVLVEAAPSTEHIIYAVHPNGFAGHMLRNKKVSRYYLQISSHDQLSDWPDERV